MKESEARELILMLKAATRTSAPLEDEAIGFWEMNLSPLDADLATKSVLHGVKQWQWFPSWAEFLEVYDMYRRLSDPVGEQRISSPLPSRDTEVPEWVWVWSWCRWKRKPRIYDHFPQQQPHVDPTECMSMERYTKLCDEWHAAGSPKSDNPIMLAR